MSDRETNPFSDARSGNGPRLADAAGRLRIVVLGYIVRGPLGGLAWHHLQYVLGLARLGHDVYFIEDSEDYPSCYHPDTDALDADPSYGLRFAAAAFERLGLGERWAYYDAHTSRWLGAAAGRAIGVCESADLLLNLSGVNPLRPWLRGVSARAFVDTDPAFTQIRHLTDEPSRRLAEQHTAFFTFAENIGERDCLVPQDGFEWRPTRQPVVLDAWPVASPSESAGGNWTTVMQWDSYRALEYGGRRFGMKSESFGDYIDMPESARPSGRRFELALGSRSAPRGLLESRGWLVLDSRVPTRDPWTYQNYIGGSRGEWSVAKGGYVVSRSGWFSERSAAYLASGRPVVTQETGFSRWLKPAGGLIPFSTPEEARAAIEEIESRYEWHCRAARAAAASFFDSRRVLSRLIESAISPASTLPPDRGGVRK